MASNQSQNVLLFVQQQLYFLLAIDDLENRFRHVRLVSQSVFICRPEQVVENETTTWSIVVSVQTAAVAIDLDLQQSRYIHTEYPTRTT